jgi:hypothetical protein
MGDNYKTALLILTCCLIAGMLCTAASAATTEVQIVKYGPDKTTVLGEKTVTYQWMEQNLPVYGDGITHYYHQGPVFVDDLDPDREQELRWNTAEDKNVREKDMGAVRGTAIRDLCDLVGGMQPGDTLTLKAEDGFSKTFAYENVYVPSARQGQMVLTWYLADEGYVPAYRQGMRLVFFSDNSTNPWGIHVFGNDDWRNSAPSQYWYYYQQGQPPEKYPTTTGLSVQYVSEIRINSASSSTAGAYGSNAPVSPTSTHPTQSGLPLSILLTATGITAVIVVIQHRKDRP